MKKIFVVAALISCSDTFRSDEVKNFIPGVYARHYSDEYTDSYDTLEIRRITTSGSEGYAVTKTMKYKRQNQSKTNPVQHKTEEWTGSYEEEKKTLLLEPSGKRIYFDPSLGEAKLGIIAYQKIKK
jgi:hypothetical protein